MRVSKGEGGPCLKRAVTHYGLAVGFASLNSPDGSCPLRPESGPRLQSRNGREVPCVDGSGLARAFFTFAALVGAAMCSAFKCGTQGRWP